MYCGGPCIVVLDVSVHEYLVQNYVLYLYLMCQYFMYLGTWWTVLDPNPADNH